MPQSFTVNGAPLELLDVGELALIHSNYKPMNTWLIDKLFPNRPSFDRDEVPMAEISTVHDLAPLVSPHQPGKPFDTKRAAKVEFVQPAYYKPKNMVTPATAFDEALMERLRTAGIISTGGQQLSDQEKMVIAQIAVMKRNHDAIDNSVLLMATELMLKGKYLLQSDDYEYNMVDYERDASLTFTPLTPWNQAGAKPITDIETIEQRKLDANGGSTKLYIMSGKVWAALFASEEFKERFVKPYAGIAVPYKPSLNVQEGASFKGYLDDKELWVPKNLKIYICDIARYLLWKTKASEEVRQRYEDAVSFLKRVSDGKAILTIKITDSAGVEEVVKADTSPSTMPIGTTYRGGVFGDDVLNNMPSI